MKTVPSRPHAGARPRPVRLGKAELEALYLRFNRPECAHPDPVEVLRRYPLVRDREIVGLVAACLAYGRVRQILRSVETMLGVLGSSPFDFLRRQTPRSLRLATRGFRHRFTSGDAMACLLLGAKRAIAEYGSLNACFVAGLPEGESTVREGLRAFVHAMGCHAPHLVPDPAGGGACKRLNLFLRWMVRKDAIDPGGWEGVATRQLIVPLDTHMARIGQILNLTRRRTADMRMALDITDALRAFAPEDPVRYDFALTRLGIRSLSLDRFLGRARSPRLSFTPPVPEAEAVPPVGERRFSIGRRGGVP